MIRNLLVAVAGCLVAATVLATAQEPDLIEFEGQVYSLFSTPLEQYFTDRPEIRHPSDSPDDGRYVTSTSLWRGYVATFGFEDGVLLLRELETLNPDGMDDDEPRMISIIDQHFPDPGTRVCNWYSGVLVLPHGPVRNYVHLGFSSMYEFQTLLRIQDGKLVEQARLDYDQYLDYKRRLFALFMETPEYRRAVEMYGQAVPGEIDVTNDDINQFIFDGGGWERFVDLEFP